MAGLLKRLFKLQQHLPEDDGGGYQPMADMAHGQGDWAPVPASATAQTPNVFGWLQEQPRLTPRRATSDGVRPRRHTIQRMYKRLAGFVSPNEPPKQASSTEERVSTTPCSSLDVREDPTLPWRKSEDMREGPTSLPISTTASVDSHHTSPTLDQPSSSSTAHDRTQSVVDQVAPRVGEDAFPRRGTAQDVSNANSVQDKDWVKVLKQYGEHLTEEELKIIKSQLA